VEFKRMLEYEIRTHLTKGEKIKNIIMAFVKLIIGLFALLFITFMSAVFGIGGFFFTLGLFAVVFWAFAK
jgi:hypothetical protein